MDMVGFIAHHGYAVTAVVLFLAASGVPLPAAAVLLAAGAMAHTGGLTLPVVLFLGWTAALAGDMLLYLGGRYTGWWLLAVLCRISFDPESCIFSAADYFYRRGAKTLLFAKFIPGVGAIAAPLAGSLHMKTSRFLRMDALGALGYCSVWIGIGYGFSHLIEVILRGIEQAGHAALLLIALIATVYGIALLVSAVRARQFRQIEKISAANLFERMQALDPDRLVVIADVRSHGYYDPGMHRIKNSIRVEPNRLKEELIALREFMVPECEIYLYCSCIRDTTSVRVAHRMGLENVKTHVIEGGMKAWIKAGGPIEMVPESDLRKLPRFE